MIEPIEKTKYGQTFYTAEADRLHPEGCRCTDRSGSCAWCAIYYGWDRDEVHA